MYRYISLVWNEADTQATETAKFLRGYFDDSATPWEVAYKGDGLLVLHTEEEKNRMQAYPLQTQEDKSGGVILGKLFKRERNPEAIAKNADLSISEARTVLHSAGRHLVDDYWGSYVAFFQDGRRKYVQVDPIGIFSCFSISYRNVEIYFTYLPDVASCKFLKFSVDWAVLAKGLRHRIDQRKVPLNEVTKILPGQCLTITPGAISKTFYWNPQKISQTDVVEDMEEASIILRQTILSTVAAMAEPYDNVIHQIGGLDSSILLAALSEVSTPLEVTCLNLYEDAPSADERYFVRQAAAYMDAPLIEYKKEIQKLSLNDTLKVPLTTAPTDHCFMPKFNKFIFDMLKERGAQAVFNGTGGDEILYAYGENFAPIDYIKAHGISTSFFRILMEASRMQGRSIWAILPEILQSGLGKSRFDVASAIPTSFLTSEIQDIISEEHAVHPWLEFRDNVTPGKIDHIEPLVYGQYSRLDSVTPENFFTTLYPYLSQPVIETCLRIPLWLMMVNGKNRGLARKAFQNYLPKEVIWRGTKSVGSRYTWSFILENIDIVQAILVDGEMIKADIIRRQNLEKILNRSHDIKESDFAFVHFYLGAELWVRKLKGDNLVEIAPFGVDRYRQMI